MNEREIKNRENRTTHIISYFRFSTFQKISLKDHSSEYFKPV